MTAIFKREFRAYFTNPIGYVILAAITCIAGYFFFQYNMYAGMADMTPVFGGLFTITLLAVPFLTMRLFSEDKRQKTDQALLTAPVSLTGIVLGKFLAALVLFAVGLAVTLLFVVIIAFQVTPDWLNYFGNLLGILLLGGMMISIGLLISSLTESQVIAALGTLGVSLLLICIDMVGSLFSSVKWVVAVSEFLSVSDRYNAFSSGIINYDNVIFFLSLQALFLFLTVRVLDRKRWN